MISISRFPSPPLPLTETITTEKPGTRAIFDALTDQRSDSAILIQFLVAVFEHGIVANVNEIIDNINASFFYDVVRFSSNVISALADHGIELVQNPNGTIRMQEIVFAVKDIQRHKVIDDSLSFALPAEVTDIISSYDDEIEIGIKNYDLIHNAFTSDDPALKRQIIHNAITQKRVMFLNEVFEEIRFLHNELDLSSVNLAGFKLNNFKLLKTNFCGANLAGANLTDADISDCNMTCTNLTLADLTRADLTRSNLTSANLFRAQLHQADLYRTNLATANLTGANFLHAKATFALFTKRQVAMDCRKSCLADFSATLEGIVT